MKAYDDDALVDLTGVGETVIEQVAWAIHCWTCVLCVTPAQMAASGQGHVTDDDLRFASFLAGALGLERREVG